MLRNLIGSQAIRTSHLGVTALSMVTHAGLIAVAAASSGNPRPYGLSSHEANVERIVYSVPARFVDPTAPTGSARHAAGRSRGKAWVMPNLSKLQPIKVPDEIGVQVPDVDGIALSSEAIDWEHEGFGGGGTSALIPAAPMRLDAVYNEAIVERAVFPRRGNPTPRYPERLRASGIDGRFFVTFVVDTAGRVEPPSIEFPETANELFVQAVRRTLLRSRYYPAEVAGRRVRQEVRQEFVFKLLP